jgi:hypothetical protein
MASFTLNYFLTPHTIPLWGEFNPLAQSPKVRSFEPCPCSAPVPSSAPRAHHTISFLAFVLGAPLTRCDTVFSPTSELLLPCKALLSLASPTSL